MPRRSRFLVTCLAALFALSCSPPGPPSAPQVDLRSKAERMAHDLIIVDTHVDVPYRLYEEMEDISVRTEKGDFDYPRARAGGLDVPFMSIYVPASYQKKGGAKDHADMLIDLVEGFEEKWPEKFAIARSTADVRNHFSRGLISLPMGMENGAPVEDDLANLRHFYDRGIRYITLTHSENNQICDSSFAKEKEWNGLSPFGRQVVAERNRLGIMIDVSHVTDDTVEQVMQITRSPVIASHSSCRKFTPGWARNISDEMITLVAGGAGVIQINFGSAFLTEEANKQSTEYWNKVEEFRKQHNLISGDEESKRFEKQYWEEHTRVYADVADVADHIDHVVQLVGIDHVGLGSDFDGVGDSLPTGLKDASEYPNLIHELLKRGYSDADIAKICGENLLRVWTEVEQVARESS